MGFNKLFPSITDDIKVVLLEREYDRLWRICTPASGRALNVAWPTCAGVFESHTLLHAVQSDSAASRKDSCPTPLASLLQPVFFFFRPRSFPAVQAEKLLAFASDKKWKREEENVWPLSMRSLESEMWFKYVGRTGRVGVCECKGSEQITAGWRQTKLFLLVKDILRFWHLGALIQPGYLL